MTTETHVMGLFREERQAVEAVMALRQPDSPWPVVRVHSPVPSSTLAKALQVQKSKVGWFTLVGGIIGFFSGFALAIFSSQRWALIVGGKPIVAFVPFVIVGFEFTILFAIFGNLIGFLHQARLPRRANLDRYDERCSGEHYGVLASCEPGDRERLAAFFKEKGGDARGFEVLP
ncbi:MAG: DUF3341 domain-containing protein [Syntrophobacteraceae bacterium]